MYNNIETESDMPTHELHFHPPPFNLLAASSRPPSHHLISFSLPFKPHHYNVPTWHEKEMVGGDG